MPFVKYNLTGLNWLAILFVFLVQGLLFTFLKLNAVE